MATHLSPADIFYQKQHIAEDKRPDIIASHVICFSLACIAVCLRFLSRRLAKIQYGADDLLIVVALFFTCGLMICNYCGLRFGLGRHVILASNIPGFAQVDLYYSFPSAHIHAKIW